MAEISTLFQDFPEEMFTGSAPSRILCLFSGFQEKSGPFHQREFSIRFCTYIPREASSPGFWSVSTYFH